MAQLTRRHVLRLGIGATGAAWLRPAVAGEAEAGTHGLSVSVALLVKDRDAGTDARLVLEDALR